MKVITIQIRPVSIAHLHIVGLVIACGVKYIAYRVAPQNVAVRLLWFVFGQTRLPCAICDKLCSVQSFVRVVDPSARGGQSRCAGKVKDI